MYLSVCRAMMERHLIVSTTQVEYISPQLNTTDDVKEGFDMRISCLSAIGFIGCKSIILDPILSSVLFHSSECPYSVPLA